MCSVLFGFEATRAQVDFSLSNPMKQLFEETNSAEKPDTFDVNNFQLSDEVRLSSMAKGTPQNSISDTLPGS